MKTHHRIIMLVSAIAIVFAIQFVYLRMTMSRQALLLLQTKRGEQITAFDGLQKLKGSSLEVFTNDYSYWDDMIRFVSHRDAVWANTYLVQGAVTYALENVWVYTPSCELVYANKPFDLPVGRAQLQGLFAKNWFPHFYINSPRGLLEIRGAPIQSASDLTRRSPPKGFFLAARLINEAYLKELSALGGNRVVLGFGDRGEPSSGVDVRSGTIQFTRELSGWDGKPLAFFSVTDRSAIAQAMSRSATRDVLLLILLVLTLLVAIWVLLARWVSEPLHIISRSLDTGNVHVLERLGRGQREFNRLADLIRKFFAQRDDLVREISDRQKAEEALLHYTGELKAALDDVKTLKGLMPICSHCKKIRDDRGYWNQIEEYIEKRSDASFSHGVCPECMAKLFPDDNKKT